MSSCAPVLVLCRGDVRRLAAPADYLRAVEAGFRQAAQGEASSPAPLHLPATDGAFHAKAAALGGARGYAALKFNANFPGNPQRHGMPTIQGAILLCDAANGALLAVLDSQEITVRRTAAATALAAQHLAKSDAASFTICGCGAQALAQIEALAGVLPLRGGFAWDIDRQRARDFARDLTVRLGLDVQAVEHFARATRSSDVIVTCTTSQFPFLERQHLRAGAFIAAVGADGPAKSELAPELLAASTVIVDLLAQCAVMGDLHHALAAGVMKPADVHAELAQVIAGSKPGRQRREEIVVFDSTGTAIQDVASAAMVFERAIAQGVGTRVALASD
jgi:alanine dehydrogenase